MLNKPDSAPHDPVVALVAEKQRLIASLKGCRTDERANEILDKSVRIDKALIKATPTTLAGAAAGLTIAKYEFETFFSRDDDGYDVVLSMIDGAIRVLERGAST
jgi:hypothetical protein